jgi:hypothetical protein
MRNAPLLILVGLLVAAPARASHNWVGLDLCRTYPERMPPELDPKVLPYPDSPDARLVGRYCSQCHYAPGPGHHTAAEWTEVVSRMDLLMGVTARFSDPSRPIEQPSGDERAALLAYLERHALQPLTNLGEVPPAYRALCGDCHAAPDPAAYAGADWPALLARMDEHRITMRRLPAHPLAQAQVTTYLGVGVAFASDAGVGGRVPQVAPADPQPYSNRWLALGPVFGLALLGLGRWWMSQRRRT